MLRAIPAQVGTTPYHKPLDLPALAGHLLRPPLVSKKKELPSSAPLPQPEKKQTPNAGAAPGRRPRTRGDRGKRGQGEREEGRGKRGEGKGEEGRGGHREEGKGEEASGTGEERRATREGGTRGKTEEGRGTRGQRGGTRQGGRGRCQGGSGMRHEGRGEGQGRRGKRPEKSHEGTWKSAEGRGKGQGGEGGEKREEGRRDRPEGAGRGTRQAGTGKREEEGRGKRAAAEGGVRAGRLHHVVFVVRAPAALSPPPSGGQVEADGLRSKQWRHRRAAIQRLNGLRSKQWRKPGCTATCPSEDARPTSPPKAPRQPPGEKKGQCFERFACFFKNVKIS